MFPAAVQAGRVSTPSTRRGMPAAPSRSSGGSTASGAFCQANGRRNRRIAVTPTEVITKLNAVFNQVMAQPEVRQSFERLNAPIVGGTPEAFGQLIRRESERWVPVIRRLGLKAE